MRIVCIGDSLTYGYGVARSQTWVHRLDQRLKEAFGPDSEAINRGISGDTTGGMLARFQREVLDASPNMVLLMGGANDLFCEASPAMFQPNLMAMAQQASKGNILPIIGIGPGLLPDQVPKAWSTLTDFHQIPHVMDQYRTWLLRFGSAFGFPVIDFSKAVPLQEDYFLDGLHPNQKGHARMADLVCSILIPPDSSPALPGDRRRQPPA